MNRVRRGRFPLDSIVFFSVILLCWQAAYWIFAVRFSVWKSYSLPSPLGIAKSAVRMIRDGSLIQAAGCSILRGMIGYMIAVIIGILMGFLLDHFPFLRARIKPLIMGIQTLPSICWVPFAILWFGLGESAIIFVVVMGSAFSMALLIENAIRNVPPIYKKAALTMGATKRQLYTKVIFPASLPEVIAGLRQGWSLAFRALMSGEVMTTSISLGQALITGRNLGDINQVSLVMIVIICTGVLMDHCLFSLLEKRIRKNIPEK